MLSLELLPAWLAFQLAPHLHCLRLFQTVCDSSPQPCWLQDPTLETKAIMGWSRKTVVLAFRGTASITNALYDLRVWGPPSVLLALMRRFKGWQSCLGPASGNCQPLVLQSE